MKKEKKKAETKEEAKKPVEEETKPVEVKEEAKPSETKEEEKPEQADYSKQTKVVALVMVVLIVSVVGVYWLVRKDTTINFNGIEFSKSQEGTVLYYKSLLGYVTATGEQIPFILKFRTNPEKLAEIPVNGKIKVLKDAIVTLSPQIANCSNTYITMLDMAMTLKAFGTTTIPATTDRNYSIKNNATLADCRNSLNKTVIVFKEGNETRIDQETVVFKNCYIAEIKNCEIRESYERFILGYIGDSIIKKDV